MKAKRLLVLCAACAFVSGCSSSQNRVGPAPHRPAYHPGQHVTVVEQNGQTYLLSAKDTNLVFTPRPPP